MRYEAIGEARYANTDPAIHFSTPEPNPDMRWRGAWMWCVRHLDYESAQLIHDRNVPPSDECANGEHASCPFSFCNCQCHGESLT
jgi:hypothetical protein